MTLEHLGQFSSNLSGDFQLHQAISILEIIKLYFMIVGNEIKFVIY